MPGMTQVLFSASQNLSNDRLLAVTSWVGLSVTSHVNVDLRSHEDELFPTPSNLVHQPRIGLREPRSFI